MNTIQQAEKNKQLTVKKKVVYRFDYRIIKINPDNFSITNPMTTNPTDDGNTTSNDTLTYTNTATAGI